MKLLIVLSVLGLCLSGCDDAYLRKGLQPTAMDVGDSVSLSYTVDARKDLCGQVLLIHESGFLDTNTPGSFPDCLTPQAKKANNGCSNGMVLELPARFAAYHYNVIIFNSGYHDMQTNEVTWEKPEGTFVCGNTSLDTYRRNIESLASLFEKHADVVIWVDTPYIPMVNNTHDPFGEQVVYNQAADAVAQAHGFYILHFKDDGQTYQLPNNVHFSTAGASAAGKELADCILTALNQQSSDDCHH